jgi:hypothetical protein
MAIGIGDMELFGSRNPRTPKTFADIEKCVRTPEQLEKIIEEYRRTGISFCVTYKGREIVSVVRA